MSINQVNLLGRIGKIETKHMPNGAAVTNLSVATNRRRVDKTGQQQEKTEWTLCVSYAKLAETIGNHFHKGSEIFITGRLQTRDWEENGQKRYMTEVIIETFSFTGGSKVGNQQGSNQSNNTGYEQAHYQGGQQNQPRQNQGFNQPNHDFNNTADFDSFSDDVPF